MNPDHSLECILVISPNIPKCIKQGFIASWACSQSSVVSSSSVRINLIVCLIELCTSFELRDKFGGDAGYNTSNVDNSDNLHPGSLRLGKGLSPEFGLLKKIVGRGQREMPTEQEAKPAVVTPSLQQWRSPSTFPRSAWEDPLKWLKEYDRVANFNKWDDMMCLANVYFFLDGTETMVCQQRRRLRFLGKRLKMD
ncbi:retrotrans_gag domain-containing protein [Trichonephila clavipes]|nr:retrotrans_gag domain-containing protein [Trichonephila clavipes]